MFNNVICLNAQRKPRRAYLNQQWAEEGARHALETYGNLMVPYHCDKCGSWHLCPANRHTPGHHCHDCSKQAYASESAAERRALILEREQGTLLRVYECPYDEGWHLTSKLEMLRIERVMRGSLKIRSVLNRHSFRGRIRGPHYYLERSMSSGLSSVRKGRTAVHD